MPYPGSEAVSATAGGAPAAKQAGLPSRGMIAIGDQRSDRSPHARPGQGTIGVLKPEARASSWRNQDRAELRSNAHPPTASAFAPR